MKKGTAGFMSGSVLVNFLMSYIIVFFLPFVTVFSILYYVCVSIVERNVTDANMASISTMQSYLETQCTRADQIAFYVNSNRELASLFALSDEQFSNADIIRINAVRRELALYDTTGVGDFADIYIYLPRCGRYISPYSSQHMRYGYDSLHPQSVEKIERWLEKISRSDTSEGRLLSHESETGRVLYYTRRLPLLGQAGNATAALVFRLNTSLYETAFEGAAGGAGEIGVLDAMNGELLTGSGGFPETLDITVFDGARGSVDIEGRTLIWSRIQPRSALCVYTMPEAEGATELRRIQQLAILLFIVCFSAGAWLTFFFTMRNYNPIKRLLNLVGPAGGAPPAKQNEYTMLRLALLDAIDERSKKSGRLNQTADTCGLRELLMSEGVFATEDAAADGGGRLGIPGVDFDFRGCHILYVTIREYSDSFFKDGEEGPHRIGGICRTVFHEIFAAGGLPVLLLPESGGFLLFAGAVRGGSRAVVARLIEKAAAFTRDNYSCEVFAVIDGPHESGPFSPRAALDRLRAADEYFRHNPPGGTAAYCSDAPDAATPGDILRSVATRGHVFYSAMQAREFGAAKAAARGVFASVAAMRDRRGLLTRQALTILLSAFIETASQSDTAGLDGILQKYLPDNEVYDYSKPDRCCETFLALLCEFEDAELAAKNVVSPQMALKRKIIDIVAREYHNPALSVGSIADRLNLSIDAASRLFKKTTLIGLLDYIHYVRVSKAEALMVGRPNITVTEISGLVGYLTCDSFIRAFKRIEGVTPGQYMKSGAPGRRS